MSELALRVVFSVVAAPLALWIALMGGAPLAALLAIVSALGAWEFFRIARAAGGRPLDDVGIALAGLLPLAIHAHYLGIFPARPALGAVVALGICAATIWLRGVDGQPLGAAAATIFGIVYTAGMLGFGYAIRYHDTVAGYDTVGAAHLGPIAVPPGGVLLIFPLLVTWGSDIGAYAFGRTIGGRKLIPAVSPGKTVAGAVGGLLTSMVVSYLCPRFPGSRGAPGLHTVGRHAVRRPREHRGPGG